MGVPKKGFLERLRVRLSLEGLYLFIEGLLSTYCGPDFALGARDLAGNKTDKHHCLCEAIRLVICIDSFFYFLISISLYCVPSRNIGLKKHTRN